MKKAILIVLTLMMTAAFGATGATSADAYKYVTAEDLNTRLGKGSPLIFTRPTPSRQTGYSFLKKAWINGLSR